jgi:hypothetical protein
MTRIFNMAVFLASPARGDKGIRWQFNSPSIHIRCHPGACRDPERFGSA